MKGFDRFPVGQKSGHIQVYCLYDDRLSHSARDRYLMRPVAGRVDRLEFGFPEGAKYEIVIDLNDSFIGELISPLEYGIFLYYGCSGCGYKFLDSEGNRLFYRFGSPCPRCGQHTVKSICDGNPHRHREYYVFQLHIKDLQIRDALSAFLGINRNNMLGFSCRGSWHHATPDTSGFDFCHVNCLDELIDIRIKEGLTGIDLFKFNFPELGVVYTGNNFPLTGWKNGRQVSRKEFDSVILEVGYRKANGLNPTFHRVFDEMIK